MSSDVVSSDFKKATNKQKKRKESAKYVTNGLVDNDEIDNDFGPATKKIKNRGKKYVATVAENIQRNISLSNDDDDFEVTPSIFLPKQQYQPYFEFTGKRILARIAPLNLINWFATFNDAQKKVITDMGFGKVLSLKLDSIPTALAFWMVENYSVHTNTVNVGNHLIHITPQYVNELMGIPIGSIPINDGKPSAKDPIVKEWRGPFQNTKWIKRPLLKEYFKMVSAMQDSGRNFMLNFLVAFFTVVGETNKNSVVNQRFLSSLQKHTNVAEFNWCDYMIRCLNRTKESWNPDTHFNGPLLLLALAIIGDYQSKKNQKSDLKAIEWVRKENLLELEKHMLGARHIHVKVEMCKQAKPSQKGKEKAAGYEDDVLFSTKADSLNDEHQIDKSLKKTLTEVEEGHNNEEIMSRIMDVAYEKYEECYRATISLIRKNMKDYPKSELLKNMIYYWCSIMKNNLNESLEFANASPDTSTFKTNIMPGIDYSGSMEPIYDKTPQTSMHEKEFSVVEYTETQFTCSFLSELDRLEAECVQKSKHQESCAMRAPSKVQEVFVPNEPVYDQTPDYKFRIPCKPKVKATHDDVGSGSPVINSKEGFLLKKESMVDANTQMSYKQMTSIVVSPYADKVVSLEEKITPLESNISYYLFSAYGPIWDIIFKINTKAENPRVVFESMRPGHYIHINVIQAWAQILNYENTRNKKNVIPILYCTQIMLHRDTYMKSDTIINKEFSRHMRVVLEDAGYSSINSFELVFVPIICEQHYYLMCFDLRNIKVEIIDNSGTEATMSIAEKYAGWPEKMRNAFSDYLIQKRHPSGGLIKRTKLVRLEMEWRTQINIVDCGVFLMRHMETYLGTGLVGWNCGLLKEDERNNAQKLQLIDLRCKYATKIVLHELNEQKKWVLGDFKRFQDLPFEVKKAAEDKADVNVLKRLLQNVD